MAQIFALNGLILVSLALIFINKWVKEEAQIFALVGLLILQIFLIIILIALQ